MSVRLILIECDSLCVCMREAAFMSKVMLCLSGSFKYI